ncbi:MAG: YfiR family protein [Myxococcota bacterium]
MSDAERGLDQGAVVNFVRSEGRVRFEVAVDAAEQRELRISSRMLAVASNVRPGKL